MTNDEVTARQVWELHMSGLAPSQIAVELCIDPEAARRMVVERWAGDKAMADMRRMMDGLDEGGAR